MANLNPDIQGFNPDAATVPGDHAALNFWGDGLAFRPAPAGVNWEAPLGLRSPWDLVWFENDQQKLISGMWRVMTKLHHRIDLKKKPGVPGATATFLGGDPVEIDATVQMWTREHLEQYRRLTQFLKGLIDAALVARKGTSTAERLAFSIYHPSLELIGVQRVIVVDIGAPRAGAIPGVLEATFKFMQFVPPSSGSARTVNGSIGDIGIVPSLSKESIGGATPPHQDPKQSAP